MLGIIGADICFESRASKSRLSKNLDRLMSELPDLRQPSLRVKSAVRSFFVSCLAVLSKLLGNLTVPDKTC